MITTSLDVLYISLAGGFLILVIFLSIALMYLTFVLRDVSKVTHGIEEVTEKINQLVLTPFKILNTLFEHIGPFIEMLRSKASNVSSSKKKGKRGET
ncbi:MAG: DUF948 domain-containing protein [Patescibacteria group bacterium]